MLSRQLVWVVPGVLMLGAFTNRFVQDDAYISFRYAQNLVDRGELTWNAEEEQPLEGYTNFLWVLMIAGAMSLGIEPVPAAQALGLAFALGTLLLTYH